MHVFRSGESHERGLIFDIGGRQTAPATGPKPSRTKAEARTSEHNGRMVIVH